MLPLTQDLTDKLLSDMLQRHGLIDATIFLESLTHHHREKSQWQSNTEQDMYPASMIKVPLALAVAEYLTSSDQPRAQCTITSQQMTNNDAPSPFVPGYEAPVWELVDFMLRQSDNVATNVLLDFVGRERGTDILRSYGLQRTSLCRYLSGSAPRINDPLSLGENTHHALDAATLFNLIAAHKVPYADRLLAALDAQMWNTKLSAGLEPGDRFAHKTGDTSDVSHDGGILTLADGTTYIIVLYTSLPSTPETDARFGGFMRDLRPYLSR